ncbi:MAG: outer membrane protein transport protein [Deltaproteobacteria bacterium]|nr:outer membrane protein transport protein [Deltaproteobacteria bacterium]
MRRLHWVVLLPALLLAAPGARGGGIELQEMSAAAQGRVLAVKARLEDASTLFYNPAGLAFLRGFQVQAGDTLVFPVFTARGPRDAAPGEEWGPVSTTNVLAAPPHAYASWGGAVGGGHAVGAAVGVNFPFGMAMTWPDDFPGRHLIAGSNLQIPEILAGVAWSPLPQLSVGAALVVSPAQVWLRRFLGPEFGLVGDDGAPIPDATVAMAGSGVGVGAAAGIQARPIRGLYLGLSYRSRIRLDMTGDAHFTLPGLTDRSGFPDQPVETAFQLPDIVSLGVGYQILEAWYAELDVEYTFWSLFEEIPLDFPDDATGSLSQAIPQDWRNTVTVRFGNEVRLGARREWAVRAGGGFDQTPVTPRYLSPMLPDSDRIFVGVGGGYTFAFGLGLDVAYLHTFFLPRAARGHACVEGSTESACARPYDDAGNVPAVGNAFPARYASDAHLLALTVSQTF